MNEIVYDDSAPDETYLIILLLPLVSSALSTYIVCLLQFNKETRNSRWRAYSRGCIDLCERYSDFAMNARSNLKEAPKDVKFLECLRSPSDPSMGERYQKSIKSENNELSSLLGTTLAASTSNDTNNNDEDVEETVDEEKAVKTKKSKRKKKKQEKNQQEEQGEMMDEDAVMKAKDEVAEGVDWSSEDEG